MNTENNKQGKLETKPLNVLNRRDFFRLTAGVAAIGMLSLAGTPPALVALDQSAGPNVLPNRDDGFTVEALENKYGIQITRPGETDTIEHEKSKSMFEIVGLEPVVTGGELSTEELELLDQQLGKIPYIGKTVNRLTIANNNLPAEGPFSVFADNPIWLNGLCDPRYENGRGRSNLYILRPPGLETGEYTLDTPMTVPGAMFGGQKKDITIREMYEAILLHESGHTFENWGISRLALNEKEHAYLTFEAQMQVGEKNPIIRALADAWGAIKPSETDKQQWAGREIKRKDITYSMQDADNAKIEGPGWRYGAAMVGYVPRYLAQFHFVPEEDLRVFPPRTLFGPLHESWADFWMIYHQGQTFTDNTRQVQELISTVDAAFRNDTEDVLLTEWVNQYNLL